jgi:cytochrome c553
MIRSPLILFLARLLPISASAQGGLAWDATVQEYHAQAGEAEKRFTFALTNASARDITLTAVTPSCGCTLVKLPSLPWKLAPGEKGRMDASMDWSGRYGLFSKTIQVETSEGPAVLTLKIHIPAPAGVVALPLARARNLQIASGDRQAVFKNACAKCHADPAEGKFGAALYSAACSICHEAEHRATMVPDLKSLPHPTDAAYWRRWITEGKAGSLMPAFVKTEGGPLSAPQIDSLVEYLGSMISTGSKAASPIAAQK